MIYQFALITHTHKYMLWYDFTTFRKFHMLFAIYFIFKILEAPVSMYKVLIENHVQFI